jgi:hypothetical protein
MLVNKSEYIYILKKRNSLLRINLNIYKFGSYLTESQLITIRKINQETESLFSWVETVKVAVL